MPQAVAPKDAVSTTTTGKGVKMNPAVKDIQEAVAQLSADDMARFRSRFEDFDAEIWDEQFEDDANAGRLDALADRALADFRAGRYEEL